MGNKVVQTLCLLLLVGLGLVKSLATNNDRALKCPNIIEPIVKIGLVIDQKSRFGKEQKIAMEIAVQNVNQSNCIKLRLLPKDSRGNPGLAASAAIVLIKRHQIQAVLGSFQPQEADLIAGISKATERFPFISLNSPARMISSAKRFRQRKFFQMANDAHFQAQCISAVVGHFKWRKVTVIYEQADGFTDGRLGSIPTLLSDSLRSVNSEIEHLRVFPRLSSLSDPGEAVEEELRAMERCSTRVFVVSQFSVESAKILFEKAKRMNMMEKGYVWIVSGEIAELLDSVDSSFKLNNMQGVIGIKTGFSQTTMEFRQFKRRFKRRFESQFPEEEDEGSNPSIFALRAHDAISALSQAISDNDKNVTSIKLSENLLSVDFEGLSGLVKFKSNGMLAKPPWFKIINVVDRSYREIAWSTERGLEMNGGPIYWVGGLQNVPRGWSWSDVEKPMRIGVPARTASNQFVRVSHDEKRNATSITGFSIDVFENVVKLLPYKLNYVFVPFNGSLDGMIKQVYQGDLGAAAGDTDIFPPRYEFVDFSQPYVSSGLEMIVTAKADTKEPWMFMKAFTTKMWILLLFMHFGICGVAWLIENQHGHNIEFNGLGDMLWFTVTIFFFAHREAIRTNLARLVLAPWLFVILIVTASITANLTSKMTVSRFKPSVVDVETLLRTNAVVGCNGKGFVCDYLNKVLKFKEENIRRFESLDEYPEALEKKHIKAAFLVAPHAKVFLAKYCRGFIKAGPPHKLIGFGFVFPKGSPLVADISEAVVKMIGSGRVDELEKAMLSSLYCSSPIKLDGGGSIGIEPFSALFKISGGIALAAFTFVILRMLATRLRIWRIMQAVLLNHAFWRLIYIYLNRAARRNRANIP